MKIFFLLCSLITLKANASKQDSLAQSKISLPSYYHLKGKIDRKYAITMELSISDYYYGCHGAYYYDTMGQPVLFASGVYQNDSIYVFSELQLPKWQSAGDNEEEFAGHFDGNIFSGLWYPRKRKQGEKSLSGLPFELQVDTSGDIPLENFFYAVSQKAGIKDRKGKTVGEKTAKFEYDLLFSRRPEDSILNKELCQMYAERDSVAGYFLHIQFNEYFNTARSQSALKNKMETEAIAHFDKFKSNNFTKGDQGIWEISYGASVLYLSDSVLSLRYSSFQGEGDRYGLGTDHYLSFSVKDQRKIEISDLINPRDISFLERLLTMDLHKKGYFITIDNIAIPDYFYVTSRGLTFFLSTEELYGTIFIPFSELGDKVKRQSWMEF